MNNRRLLSCTLTIGPNRHPQDQIRDAEAFCRTALDDAFDGWGMYLRPDDYDESLSLLITHLWRLNERFDPGRNDCFANYARSIIPKRAADVGPRRLLGRNGNRIHDYIYDPLDEEPTRQNPTTSQPHTPLSHQQSHPDPDRGTDDPGLLALRDRERAWAAGVLGVRTPRVAA
jgi:hypothetical protein